MILLLSYCSNQVETPKTQDTLIDKLLSINS